MKIESYGLKKHCQVIVQKNKRTFSKEMQLVKLIVNRRNSVRTMSFPGNMDITLMCSFFSLSLGKKNIVLSTLSLGKKMYLFSLTLQYFSMHK